METKGFSLIEILITLSVFAIITVMALPLFSEMIQNYRLKTAAENLYYSLQYARSEAVKRNQTVYMNFNTGDTWCFGIKAGSTCDCTVSGSCTLGTTTAANAQELSLSLSGMTSNTLQFDAIRAGANAAAIITYTAYGQTPAVSINVGLLGSTQICSNTLTDYQTCP